MSCRNEREAFDALNLSCPPCNGNCRQGRDCPANREWDRPPLTPRERRERTVTLRWLVLGVVVFWVVVIAGLRSCAR